MPSDTTVFLLRLGDIAQLLPACDDLYVRRTCWQPKYLKGVQLLLPPSTNVLGEKPSNSVIYPDYLQKFTQNLV